MRARLPKQLAPAREGGGGAEPDRTRPKVSGGAVGRAAGRPRRERGSLDLRNHSGEDGDSAPTSDLVKYG